MKSTKYKFFFYAALVAIAVVALNMFTGCNPKKQDPPNQVSTSPTPSSTIAPTTPTQTPPVVVADHCDKTGATIECEAQMSYELKTCKKADGSDWAPMYFKDVAEMDAYAKAKGTGTQMGIYPDVKYYGKDGVGAFGWHCKFIN